ncbi:MAG TPA: hypothetical protein VL944_00970 [Candidatus Acidoferrum sp.]|nr:hypothetical protein [Candidatus Acidoferrum sp.]
MPKSNQSTFIISRIELRKILSAYGVTEKKMDELFSNMEKAHRHIDAVQFIGLLGRAGLSRERSVNVLRRINMNDIMIEQLLDMADESRISAETGRLYVATLDSE